MALDINLKIYIPEKIVLNQDVYRAVLAFDNKTITVMNKRAPTIVALDMGIMQILNENNDIIDEYYLSGGIADIKENSCIILTEAALRKSDLDLEKIIEMNNQFRNPFYSWLIDEYKRFS